MRRTLGIMAMWLSAEVGGRKSSLFLKVNRDNLVGCNGKKHEKVLL